MKKEDIPHKEDSFSFSLFLGMLLGIAFLLPSISSGAILFLFGQYENFLEGFSIQLQKRKIILRQFLHLMGGLLIALLLFSHFFHFLFSKPIARVYLYSFFLGAAFVSFRIIQKKILYWKVSQIFYLAAGMLLASFSFPGQIPKGILATSSASANALFSGISAACAFLLPGFSLGMIRALVGIDDFFSIANLSFFNGLALFLGMVGGGFFLAKLLSYFMTNYREKTLSFFLGSMLGAFPMIWPFGPFIHYPFILNKESDPFLGNQQMVISFLCIIISYALLTWFHKWHKKDKKILVIPE